MFVVRFRLVSVVNVRFQFLGEKFQVSIRKGGIVYLGFKQVVELGYGLFWQVFLKLFFIGVVDFNDEDFWYKFCCGEVVGSMVDLLGGIIVGQVVKEEVLLVYYVEYWVLLQCICKVGRRQVYLFVFGLDKFRIFVSEWFKVGGFS